MNAPQAVIQAQSETIEGEIRIEWKRKRIQIDPRVATFEEGVKAYFGPTILYADFLSLNFDTKEGTATGKVRIVDPEGTFEANNLQFNWVARTGKAEQVSVDTTGAKLFVRSVEIRPDQWLLIDARTTLCGAEKNPWFWLTSSSTTLRPGRSGRARKVGIEILGLRLGPIPFVGFSLDRRVTGFRLPAISFRRRVGIGVAWSSSFLLQEQLSLTGTAAAFPTVAPSYGALATYSFVPAMRSRGLVAPRSDLAERFAESYMDNITTIEPSEEDAYLRDERRSISLSTSWNQSTKGRVVDFDAISKQFEAIGEFGGALGPVGGFMQVRGQSIRDQSSSPFTQRAMALGSANTSLKLGKTFDLRLRADGSTIVGRSNYSWIRGQASLVVSPIPQFRCALGYTAGAQFGTPQYGFDGLGVLRSIDLRGDLVLGPLSVSALFRYDPGQRRWYDHEYALSLIAGCVVPYVVFRQSPSDVRFGVRFRLDALLDKLQQRDLKRSAAPTKQDAHGH